MAKEVPALDWFEEITDIADYLPEGVDRSGAWVARHLAGYRGIVQVDGYAAYNRLAKPDRTNDAVTLAGCWAHVRRKHFELHVNESSKLATQTVQA
ncbi:MAG: IS66 family transposase [Rhizomicrobium sp.]